LGNIKLLYASNEWQKKSCALSTVASFGSRALRLSKQTLQLAAFDYLSQSFFFFGLTLSLALVHLPQEIFVLLEALLLQFFLLNAAQAVRLVIQPHEEVLNLELES